MERLVPLSSSFASSRSVVIHTGLSLYSGNGMSWLLLSDLPQSVHLNPSMTLNWAPLLGLRTCWANVPGKVEELSKAWQGQYAGRSGNASIILEVVASYDLWIWHTFFGTPGSLNDINVLHRSPVFKDILEGRAPKVSYVVNGNLYNMGYYLTVGIYPAWATFVKLISNLVLQKHKLYAQQQEEGVRKDVERAFGVLQARFAFIQKPSLIWDDRLMGRIMKACIIMHNMIVEDERHTYKHYDPSDFRENDNNDDDQTSASLRQTTIMEYMANKGNVEDRRSHEALKNYLIEHI